MAPKTNLAGNVSDGSLRRAVWYTLGLRAAYALAALLRGRLTADSRLVRSNDFTGHLISRLFLKFGRGETTPRLVIIYHQNAGWGGSQGAFYLVT